MKVKIMVEFDVETSDPGEADALTESEAKDAASLAAYDYLVFFQNGVSVWDGPVCVHVDGFGECWVTLGEDHE